MSAGGAPPKILFVINSLRAGGGETQMVHLALGLSELGFRVTVACLEAVDRDLTALEGANVRIIDLAAGDRSTKLRRLPLLIRLARGADVVCSALFDAMLFGRVAAAVARRPSVVIEHMPGREVAKSRSGRSRAKLVATHNRVLDRFTYAMVAVAFWQLDMLRSEGVSEGGLRVIHNGVPVDEIRRLARTGVTRSELGIPEDATVLIHLARFYPQKNQAATLEVARRLREDLGDVHVLFVGSGPGFTESRARAEAAGTIGWAHFLGRREDVPRLLGLSDVSVLPSFAEAMPMSILESLAVGIPVVASDVADVRRILETTEAGIVVPIGDDDAYERALRRLLTEPRLRERLSQAAAHGSRAHFDYTTMAERYAAILRAAIAGAPVPTIPSVVNGR